MNPFEKEWKMYVSVSLGANGARSNILRPVVEALLKSLGGSNGRDRLQRPLVDHGLDRTVHPNQLKRIESI